MRSSQTTQDLLSASSLSLLQYRSSHLLVTSPVTLAAHARRGLIIVLGAPSTARTVELYKTLNWSTLDQRRRYHTATYVLNGLSPPYLQNTLEFNICT